MEVGGFSRIDGEQHFDKRALRRYIAPKLPASLATGYSDFVPKRDDKAKAEQCLLAAVERYAEQTSRAHFVTYRNNLNKLKDIIKLESLLLKKEKLIDTSHVYYLQGIISEKMHLWKNMITKYLMKNC